MNKKQYYDLPHTHIQRAAINTRKNRRIKNSSVKHCHCPSYSIEFSHSQNILAVVTMMVTEAVWDGEVAWCNSVMSGVVGVHARVQGERSRDIEEWKKKRGNREK